MNITLATTEDYEVIVDLWERSVRATHEFLPEKEIAFLKPLILNSYLAAVNLRIVKNEDQVICGFVGVADSNIEMLFVEPNYFGKGIGKRLVQYAIKNLSATKVDVNEDNEGALNFYIKMGFEVSGRSPLDGQGKPYPILHMSLS